MIKAIDSDIYDVLSYVAFNTPPVTRKERVQHALSKLNYQDEQMEFVNFILEQYLHLGFKELDNEKLPKLIHLKYQSINKAKQVLGSVEDIRNLFVDFQQHIYSNL